MIRGLLTVVAALALLVGIGAPIQQGQAAEAVTISVGAPAPLAVAPTLASLTSIETLTEARLVSFVGPGAPTTLAAALCSVAFDLCGSQNNYMCCYVYNGKAYCLDHNCQVGMPGWQWEL